MEIGKPARSAASAPARSSGGGDSARSSPTALFTACAAANASRDATRRDCLRALAPLGAGMPTTGALGGAGRPLCLDRRQHDLAERACRRSSPGTARAASSADRASSRSSFCCTSATRMVRSASAKLRSRASVLPVMRTMWNLPPALTTPAYTSPTLSISNTALRSASGTRGLSPSPDPRCRRCPGRRTARAGSSGRASAACPASAPAPACPTAWASPSRPCSSSVLALRPRPHHDVRHAAALRIAELRAVLVVVGLRTSPRGDLVGRRQLCAHRRAARPAGSGGSRSWSAGSLSSPRAWLPAPAAPPR